MWGTKGQNATSLFASAALEGIRLRLHLLGTERLEQVLLLDFVIRGLPLFRRHILHCT